MEIIKRVDVSDYPSHLSWENKSFTMPNIPRGNNGMIDGLYRILELVNNNSSPSLILDFDGSSSRMTLGKACVRLRPMGLVLKTQNSYTVSEYSKKWLNSKDNLYLAALLCSRIKFLGEILYYLDTPKTANQLQNIAINDYSLSWKTISEINARLVWLRQLELVEFESFSLLYKRTKMGDSFINSISIEEPIMIDYSRDETELEDELPISNWAVDYCNDISSNRKSTIGYIAGDLKQFDVTMFEFIQLLNGGKNFDQILQYVTTNFGISPSSLKSFLSTLTNMNILARKTNTIYEATPIALKWCETRYILDLLCIIHKNFGYVLELLDVLQNRSLNYKELAAIAKVSYGFDKENIDEIRKRVSLLKSAKLVMNSGLDTYTITARAKKLLPKITIIKPLPSELEPEKDCISNQPTNSNLTFFTDLRLAAKDSTHFKKLEELVKIAFEKLGFEAQWIGGSGNTDVLIKASGINANAFTVAVDAKSTATGNVNDGLVDFDTLLEHKKKHHADYSAIVGGVFHSERLINRAIDHGVVLIDIDTLEMLVKNHMEIPLNVTAYKKLFQQSGIASVACLDSERSIQKRYGNLMHEIMDCLIIEREDPVTQGILQERDIYMALRRSSTFESVLNIDEITNMLSFLSSPLIGCVEKNKDGYYAIGTLKDASQKFEFFAKMCR